MGLYRHRPATPPRRRPTFPVPWPRVLGADFDGTNDYLTRGAGLTGAADGRKGMVSFWIRFTGGDGAFAAIVEGTGQLVQIIRTNTANGDCIRINVYSSGVVELMSMTTSGGKLVSAGLMHVLASWDLTAGRAQVYVNDASDRSGTPTLTDADIDYTLGNWRIGAAISGAGNKLQGSLHELWFSFTDSLDLSVEANRRKFISAARGPVYLGTDGSGPTGSAPIIYLRGDHAAFGANSGTGGDLTLTGTLTEPAFRPGVKSLAETTTVIVLVVQDAAHGHTAEQPTLTQAHVLAVAEALHGHAADNATLTQAHMLATADALHGHAADGVVLTQAHVLALDDALHGHGADSVVLTQAHVLVLADALHGHEAESPTLTQAHVLVVADTLHDHAADNVTLDVNVALAPDDAAHGHAAEAPTLTQAHALAVAEALHALASESPSLTQAHLLAIADALHAHAADNVTLNLGAVLEMADALHAHAADGVVLTQAHVLAVADALHAMASEAPALTQAHLLAVADALHAHAADNVTLSEGAVLEPADALHAHAAEAPTMSQAHVLAILDAVHGHSADSPSLTQAHLLVVSDALHALFSDNATLAGYGVDVALPGVLVLQRAERVFVVRAVDDTLVIIARPGAFVTTPRSDSTVIH